MKDPRDHLTGGLLDNLGARPLFLQHGARNEVNMRPWPFFVYCGRGGPGQLVVDPREAIRQGKGAAIKQLRLGRNHFSIEVHDHLKACLTLCRIYGLFDGRYQAEQKQRAEAHWTRAIDLLPADVVKQVHLALLEASDGKPY